MSSLFKRCSLAGCSGHAIVIQLILVNQYSLQRLSVAPGKKSYKHTMDPEIPSMAFSNSNLTRNSYHKNKSPSARHNQV